MTLLSRLGAIAGALMGERRAVVDLDALLAKYFGLESKSGVSVTVERALEVTTVFACIRVIAEGNAQIPCKLYREDATSDSRAPARDHPLYHLLHRRPNPWQTSFAFRETLTAHAALAGGGFAYKNMVRGRLVELIPIMPSNMRVRRVGYEPVYDIVHPTDGTILGGLTRRQVFHLPGPSWDGSVGLDVLRLLKEAIGLAIALEENHSRLHRNGSQVGGVLTTDQSIDEKDVIRIRELWTARQSGAGNAFKTAVLDKGFKWLPIGMSGVDSEHVRTREHQIMEICRALRVFPQMIGFADKTATYASAEQFFINHVVHCLGPWIDRWQQELENQLLTDEEQRQGFFFRLDPTALLRGDSRARAELYKSGILTGWMTRNEARRLEDLDPLEGLDEPLVPLNMGIGGTPPAPEGEAQASPWPNVPIAPRGVVAAFARYAGVRQNVGRVLSGRNETRIRNAQAELDQVLAELDAEDGDDAGGDA